MVLLLVSFLCKIQIPFLFLFPMYFVRYWKEWFLLHFFSILLITSFHFFLFASESSGIRCLLKLRISFSLISLPFKISSCYFIFASLRYTSTCSIAILIVSYSIYCILRYNLFESIVLPFNYFNFIFQKYTTVFLLTFSFE